ncbi:EAL domain-containing protein [Shewanella sp. D64]|uniref:bifunctional diguanylate cyclase/phosphodiesterase n=1 Tax=unclassified Shewanella TaxID=196818 RepID=UPI0022BA6B23|nr:MULTISPECIES: EAL domain-containing protein [unclassified Shewanella]MEC4727365.1 EAL domain-containing protein [Shewanella sp. D64]MEC4739520.1 EAL domain-containing protein [Shewanella sp. E94]WBJ96096.1 EAL domain-containing protein [Shewanella sp. MTB7]
MTLFRQIYSLLFGLFLLVVASLGYVQFTETQSFLTKQMESDLNNTSNSLGIMLVPDLEAGDIVGAETLINVIFEGGYYQQVKLTWLVDGKQQIWNNPIHIEGVPKWFVDLDFFHTIKKESTITSGWIQLANLEITAHPGFGYHELWRTLTNAIIVFSILFLIAIVMARVGLTWILKPLNEIAKHAKEIAQRKFGPDMQIPKTAELKSVVLAFNSMSDQLKQLFNSLDEEVGELRKKNLVDQASGLPNRQYMMGRLNSWLNEPAGGALVMAKFDWLEEVHSKYGYQVRDETIKLLAEKMKEQLDEVASSVIARIAAYEFAFLITSSEHDQTSKYLQTLIRTINQEMSKAGCKPNENFAIGVAERIGQMSVSDILAQTDNALQKAIKEDKVFHWFETNEKQLFTREQWREHLSAAIQKRQFKFKWQPVHLNNSNNILQRELYCQLNMGDKIIHAGQFMPYVELLSLGSLLDRCLIEDIQEKHLLSKNHEPIAVNLTFQSLSDPKFHEWLNAFLRSTSLPERICFDIPEAAVYSDPDACHSICSIIRDNGAHFGIDHFGRQFGSMSYLQSLRPSYVKLDQSFAYYDDSEHSGELCRAIINVARGLDIKVIVTGIEEMRQLERFTPLKTNAFMGYIFPPTEIED